MVAAARKIGAKVFVLSNVGEIPDLLILYPSTPSGQLYLIEVKNGKNGLTPTQKKFFDEWGMCPNIGVCNSVDSMLRFIGAIK